MDKYLTIEALLDHEYFITISNTSLSVVIEDYEKLNKNEQPTEEIY